MHTTSIGGEDVPISEEYVWTRPFCKLLRFKREFSGVAPQQSKLLIIAPMSGHYATLLRGTVEAFLPTHDVYVTDWTDARAVPMSDGHFDLDDYIDYLAEIMTHLSKLNDGAPLHTLGVCQASVPLICAIASMEAKDDPHVPESMVLMGGPIDPRVNPTAVNRLAQQRGIGWFKQHCIHTVPFPNPGMGRKVYPGFLQLSGFMAMNMERHVSAHFEMFNHLVEGDGDSAERASRLLRRISRGDGPDGGVLSPNRGRSIRQTRDSAGAVPSPRRDDRPPRDPSDGDLHRGG